MNPVSKLVRVNRANARNVNKHDDPPVEKQKFHDQMLNAEVLSKVKTKLFSCKIGEIS